MNTTHLENKIRNFKKELKDKRKMVLTPNQTDKNKSENHQLRKKQK